MKATSDNQLSLKRTIELLEADILVSNGNLDQGIGSVISSDLISDILMYLEEDALLLTALVNQQIIRVADMIDIAGIVFVMGKTPEKSMIEMAEEKNVAISVTEKTLYEASGDLYEGGLRPCKYGGS